MVPNRSIEIRDNTLVSESQSKAPIFKVYPPNTTSVVKMGSNTYFCVAKESTVLIKGCTNFKNITDSTVTIEITEKSTETEKAFLLPFSEVSYTREILEISINVDNKNAEKSYTVRFTPPEIQQGTGSIVLIGEKKLELNDSQMTRMAFIETQSGYKVLHYLFFHEFIIITNFTYVPIDFEMKITGKKKIERITGTVTPEDIKQMSGSIDIHEKRKVRLRIEKKTEIHIGKEKKK